MGLYLRKSLKFGPMRVNLSKGGLGYSVGVKGLRVGTNAAGRSYMHAGRGGIYVRESLGTSMNKNAGVSSGPEQIQVQDESLSQTEVKARALLDFAPESHSGLWKTLAVVGFLIFLANQGGGNGMLLGLGLLLGPIAMLFIEGSQRSSLESQVKAISEKANEQDYEGLVALLETFRGRTLGGIDLAVVSSAYQELIPKVLEDRRVSEGEAKCLAILRQLVPAEVRGHINAVHYSRLIASLLDDDRLSEEEDALLALFKQHFEVPEAELVALEADLEFFREVETLSKALPEPQDLEPALKEKIYFAVDGARLLKSKVLKRRQVDGQKQSLTGMMTEAEGRLLVGEKTLFLVGEGVQKWPFKNIVSYDHDAGEKCMSLVLTTRKAPIVLSTPQNAKIVAVLRQLV